MQANNLARNLADGVFAKVADSLATGYGFRGDTNNSCKAGIGSFRAKAI